MAEPQIIYRVAAHLSSKGDLAKAFKAKAQAVNALGSKFDAVSSKALAFGRDQVAAVGASAAAVAKFGAVAAGVGIGSGLAFAVAKGAQFNVGMEKAQNTIAGTLQLYNHSAGAVDQIGTNVKVAGAALQELNRIADSSPGEFQDISMMFQNMLPGARSTTGEMKRILALSQNLALFTPTLTGGDFMTSGAQMSRILTGSAGAEMDTWKRLAPVILDVGHAMEKTGSKEKVFGKDMVEANEKLTIAFNKLSSSDRLRLVEKAFERGGPALAKMYEESWEGASSSFISGWRKIAGAGTRPMFLSMKEALLKANKESGGFSKANQAALASGASIVGGIINKSFVKVLDAVGRGVSFLAENWQNVANSVYHGLQIGSGLIKAAFAFGFSRMVIGAGVLAASTAARAGVGATRGIVTGFKKTRAGIQHINGFAKSIGNVVDAVAGPNKIANALGIFTKIGTVFGAIASAGVVLVPMLLVAGVALGALSLVLVGVAGVAAYVASRWTELSASVRDAFADGTLTFRPVIISALLFWEKLKAIGHAFIGGASGADMARGAINGMVTVVDMLSTGVSTLARIAAFFLDMVSKAAKTYDVAKTMKQVSNPLSVSGFTSGLKSMVNYASEAGGGGAVAAAMARARGEVSFTDHLDSLSAKLYDAADRADAVGLKDLDFSQVDDLTKKVDDYAKALTAGDQEAKKKKGPAVNIGTLVQQFDLRGEDPDRAMVAWVEPIERLARAPGGSTLDMGGF